ncbi:MAG: ABC transporter permease [Lutibacter sp.]|jgi:ABC-2 type transport system permease protein
MNTILYIIQKEFKQIFRDKSMLPIIFILPLIQLLVLSNAATFEIKNIKFSYIDNDKTYLSRSLIEKFNASTYFHVITEFPSTKEANVAMLKGQVEVILEIPRYFERDLSNQTATDLSITIDAIDGAAAGVQSVYINRIVQTFDRNAKVLVLPPADIKDKPKVIESIPASWFNITLAYKTFMVPGILVLLVSMITLFLSGMNIVREKEIGTLEQINVTPIKKYQFIIGKLFPFWIIGFALLTVGLIIAKLVFGTPMLGSIGLIYFYTAIYLLVILGMGLFISNFTDTQQQAMFIAWFFIIIFILMSGLFTPIESMPRWAQITTEFNPIKFFVEIMRMVMLKGSGFMDIVPLLIKTTIYAIVMNGLAVWSYKKTN